MKEGWLRAISRLSGRQREILYLYYVKELSHQEISAILGMNPQSSKNLLSRTLARLREFFFLCFNHMDFQYLGALCSCACA